MADRPQLANVTVSYEMHSDPRFRCLAELGGWTHGDACWRMVTLWARCTALQTDRPPAAEIRVHLGIRGEELLLAANLAEPLPCGGVRVLGGGLSGGDTNRFGWYGPVESRNAKGGKVRAANARRVGGRFVAGEKSSSVTTSVTSVTTSVTTSDSSISTSIISEPPASGFRISEEDQNSLPRAIPPSTEGSGQPVPPPAETTRPHETQQGAATPGMEATAQGAVPAAGNVAESQRAAVTIPRAPHPQPPVVGGDRDPKPTNAIQAYDPVDPFARGRLAESTWRRTSDARIAVAGELGLPAPLPFPAITPGSHPRGFVELSNRIREEGTLAPASCDRVVENAVRQARAKRSIDWLGERLFGDKAWPNARDGVDPSARATVARRGDPVPPPPPAKRPERPPPDPVRSAEDMAAMLAQAAAAAEAPERGREIAALPTAELVKRFGSPDGARAPPVSAGPDDTPTDQPRRRKAST